MPTTRPRHTVTETDEIARALDDAAEHWPEERTERGRLLLRLVQEGHRTLQQERTDHIARRRAAIRRWSGALTGSYPEGYLARLRDEWPE